MESLLAMGAGVIIVYLAIMVFMIITMWKVLEKGGQPGWAILIPIYNIICILAVAGKPWWWLFLMLIPIVNFVIMIIVYIGIAKGFGKDAGFAIGLLLLGIIFFPILAFNKDIKYVGFGSPAAPAA